VLVSRFPCFPSFPLNQSMVGEGGGDVKAKASELRVGVCAQQHLKCRPNDTRAATQIREREPLEPCPSTRLPRPRFARPSLPLPWPSSPSPSLRSPTHSLAAARGRPSEEPLHGFELGLQDHVGGLLDGALLLGDAALEVNLRSGREEDEEGVRIAPASTGSDAKQS